MRLPAIFVCLSVCLLARLLKNACMDLDEILRVDRCRDMDELQGRFYIGAGGHRPPNVGQPPPKYFGSNSKNRPIRIVKI